MSWTAPASPPAEVRAEVRRRIDDLAPGGGYIAAPSHTVPYNPAIREAMVGEIATYGRGFYKAAENAGSTSQSVCRSGHRL